MSENGKRTGALYVIQSVLFGLIVLFCAVVIIWRIFGDPVVRVSGSSMYPTYKDGDLLTCTKHVGSKDLERGDVVVIRREDDHGKKIIKRVIGFPGELISVTTSGVYINGELHEDSCELPLPEFVCDEIFLGPGEYFVLGDNRNNSMDSRSFGPVSLDEIQYKVKDYSWIMRTAVYRWIEKYLGGSD